MRLFSRGVGVVILELRERIESLLPLRLMSRDAAIVLGDAGAKLAAGSLEFGIRGHDDCARVSTRGFDTARAFMKTALRRFLALTLAFALVLAPIPARAVDYSVTAASVVCSNARFVQRGTAAATITAGQGLALDSTGNLVLCDANSGTALTRTLVGISLNAAATGQPVNYTSLDDSFTPGFTVAAGAIVIVSTTAGGLSPAADATTGHYVTVVGVGIGSNKIKLGFLATTAVFP